MYVCRYARSKEHPVDVIAKDIASSTKLLCLDELHVSDVADALILSQVARLPFPSSCVRTVHIVYVLRPAVTPYQLLQLHSLFMHLAQCISTCSGHRIAPL